MADKQSFFRKYLAQLWLFSIPLVVIISFFSVRTFVIRSLFLAGCLIFFAGLLVSIKNQILHRSLKYIYIALFIFVCLPFGSSDRSNLIESYLSALKSYRGIGYVWGGENHRGIDCSGLVRMGLVDAAITRACKTFNPNLLREAFHLWFFDSSAKALLNSHRKRTVRLFEADSILKLDHERLKAGDLAVTSDGKHVLAYLGDKQWIQAAPDQGKVTIEAFDVNNHWFRTPVVLMRWGLFSDSNE